MTTEAMRQPDEGPEFEVYANGIIYCSVCSSLPPEETEGRVNAENPSGTTNGWKLHDGTFRTGEPNPYPCNRYPDTHKHYLFVC